MTEAEWGFTESPDQVDLERLIRELQDLPAIYAAGYLGSLHEKAPMTYQRLRQRAESQGRLRWVRWHP